MDAYATHFWRNMLMASNVSKHVALVQFVASLQPNIGAEVGKKIPETLTDAVHLARSAEFALRRGGSCCQQDLPARFPGAPTIVPWQPNSRPNPS